MKIILTHEVSKLGEPGDVVDVRDGYARNYLLPRKLATPWTKGGEKQVESIRAARENRAVKSLEEAQEQKAQLEGRAIKVKANTTADGRLFGAVSSTEIVEAIVAAGGPEVDKRRVETAGAIKTLGDHAATVRLHPEVLAELKLQVVQA
ncbi:LSU ribosomal protein L9P [Kytococcus aerolatus]|uniref:Large ribosomal subunit protein bL9 n=1 Tax=Kytococcus aerolatus TaxID=592308 RepID=A0A212THA4_9MICO|nr:50S ribosomal protein L9 [Kytococcus aerolatus]SNC65437.1 LSU ribosomal protein L9P [Kytococcus aerolatus]